MKGEAMGYLRHFLLNAADSLIGPFDWNVVNQNGIKKMSGDFRVFDRKGRIKLRVGGYIIENKQAPAGVFLYDPPQFVKAHRHSHCLQLLRPGDKWFKLHFEKPAANFVEAYTYVEHLLTEAYNLTH